MAATATKIASRAPESLRQAVKRTRTGYRLYLRYKHGARGGSRELPGVSHHNAVLKTSQEWERSLARVRELGLPPHAHGPKNWDALAALDCILRETGPDARVLDAGGETYSVILPWLWLYGYRDLTCVNLVWQAPFIYGGAIRYEPGDLTRTRFGDETLDAVTCLSVVEHGVDLDRYFAEMARVLKPGGVVVTSTDYYPDPVDTRGHEHFGVPVRIFSEAEVRDGLELAATHGLHLTAPLDLSAGETTVRWEEHDLDYTFLVFVLRKATDR